MLRQYTPVTDSAKLMITLCAIPGIAVVGYAISQLSTIIIKMFNLVRSTRGKQLLKVGRS